MIDESFRVQEDEVGTTSSFGKGKGKGKRMIDETKGMGKKIKFRSDYETTDDESQSGEI